MKKILKLSFLVIMTPCNTDKQKTKIQNVTIHPGINGIEYHFQKCRSILAIRTETEMYVIVVVVLGEFPTGSISTCVCDCVQLPEVLFLFILFTVGLPGLEPSSLYRDQNPNLCSLRSEFTKNGH